MTGTGPAVLERERIERMRAEVMGTIETARAARRGRRRARIALGGIAAAAVVVIGGVIGTGVIGGQTGGSDSQSATSDVDRTTITSREGGAAVDEADGKDAPLLESVITTGTMTAEVDDIDEAVARIRAFAAAQGGRIDSESIGGGKYPYAELTVRVPAPRVTTLRALVDDRGEVTSMDVQREDVETRVADVEARIASLETSIRRLRAIIAESSTTRDLLDAEAQLTQRQSNLETLQAQRRVLNDRTSLATMHVSLHPVEGVSAVEPGGFRGGLTTGWNALVATTNAIVTAAGVATPWLVPLGLLAGLVVLVRRRRGRRR